jgi:glycosyltransferase involved in cell wall biosynthesis
MAAGNVRTKNILLVIPSLGIGGAEKSLANLSLELARRYKVYVCIFNEEIPIAFPFGGELLTLNVSGASTILGKLRSFYRRVIALRTLKKRYAIDVCISFLEGADFINILSKRREKVFISVRSSKIHNEFRIGKFDVLRQKMIVPLLYRRADKIIVIQKDIVHELITHLNIAPEQTTVINNFFDHEYIQILGKERVKEDCLFKGPTLIAFGRLVEVKGFSHLLHVFSLILETDPRVRLLILGDGPLKDKLIAQAKNIGLGVQTEGQLNAQASVHFLGNQLNPFRFVAKAKLFVQGSLSESFGNSMVEAMVLGIPVISTDCPYGPREILAPISGNQNQHLQNAFFADYGILMPLWKERDNSHIYAAWATTILQILNNQDLLNRYSSLSMKRAEDYSKEKIANEWCRLIDS